jgi:hypothetical protein
MRSDTLRLLRPIAAASLCTLPVISAKAQSEPPVTQEQYDEIKRELEKLKATVRSLTNNQEHPATRTKQDELGNSPVESSSTNTVLEFRQEMKRTNLRIDDLEQQTFAMKPGDSKFHIAGYAVSTLNVPDGGESTFSAAVVPLILWKINDRLLFETEFELGLNNVDGTTETEVVLEYADLQYLVNDYVVVGAGKFLSQFGLFSERLHPSWINKLPNSPLIRGHDGLAPFTSVGAYVRGAVPIGAQRINYVFYVTNGPSLVDATEDVEDFGGLDFEAISENKAVGGRIGYLPDPKLEFGFSMMYGEANSDGGLGANTTILGFDASYILDTAPGLFDFRFEYIYSMVDRVTFDAGGSLGVGPLQFNNNRQGLYAQIAFRPIHAKSEILKKFEVVSRYDYMSVPVEAPEGGDQKRWTFGVNYWLNPNTVFKVSIDDTRFDGERATQNIRAMIAVGF